MENKWKIVLAVPVLFWIPACSFVHDGYGVRGIESSQLNEALRLQQAITYRCKTVEPKVVDATGRCPDGVVVVDYVPVSPPTYVSDGENSILKVERGTPLVSLSCFQPPTKNNDEKEMCRLQRNAAVWVLLMASNNMCQEHLKGIYGNEAASNVVTGTLTTLFSGAASVTTPASASKVLAALGSFSSAERSLINDVIYKERLVSAITAKIAQGREQIGRDLASRQKDGVDDYSLNAALYDVLKYHNTCSFMYGLEKALIEGQQDSSEVEKARLEKEKTALEAYISNQKIIGKSREGASFKCEIDDAGCSGATKRLEAVEKRLLALITPEASASQSAPTVGKPKEATKK